MWGTWWVWDARLTSVLVLFFLYLGYIALVERLRRAGRGARAGAILALVGIVNLPIIKFSVDWWNTLHQPASVFRLGGPTIAASMLWPLLIMALGFTLFFVALLLIRMRTALIAAKIRALRRAEVERRGAAALGERRCHERAGRRASSPWAAMPPTSGRPMALTLVVLGGLLSAEPRAYRRRRRELRAAASATGASR